MTADVFNLDLHVSVIMDVKVQLARLNQSVVDWTLSGHSWVAGRDRDPIAVVNERTWMSFGPRMAGRFRTVYGSYLGCFRAFVAAYPPCFALLYEGLGKPTLALAATRYEWPLTHSQRRWGWLNDGFRSGVESGWLTLMANNRADADYLESYLGLRPACIPSACSYVGVTYTGSKTAAVVCTMGPEFASAICARLRAQAVPLRDTRGTRWSWSDLYDHRALVVIPYNVSLMSLFEHYTACAPIYVPDRTFLKHLLGEYPREVLSQLSFTQVTGKPASYRPDGIDLNDIADEQVVDWYLDRADFYDPTWMPSVRRFESWDHLDDLLHSDDPMHVNAEMSAERANRLSRIDALWDALPWANQLVA